MKTLQTYSDGGRRVEVAGVIINVGRRGDVCSLSDWSRVNELVAAGVLAREVWRGNGMYGHDTYKLVG